VCSLLERKTQTRTRTLDHDDDVDDDSVRSMFVDDESEQAGDAKRHRSEKVRPRTADDDDIIDTDPQAKTYTRGGKEESDEQKELQTQLYATKYKPRITYPPKPIVSNVTSK
jgi:hypothetical protein